MAHPTFQTNMALSVTRRFTVSDELALTVTIVNQPFRGRIFPPTEADDVGATDGAPRAALAPYVLWYKPGQTVGDIRAGDRLSDGVDDWEVVRTVHGKRAGLTVLINEVMVHKVDDLYPVVASLREKGGAHVLFVPMALWSTVDNDTSRGTYRTWNGEAPVEYYDMLSVTNREMIVNGRVLTIDDCTLNVGQPHVALSLREGIG